MWCWRGTATRLVQRVLALGVALALAGMAVQATETAEAGPPGGGVLHWSPCYKDVGAEFGVSYECAQYNVPLDHDEPTGPKVQLALVRLPATAPDAKAGTIFLNPGGPGGSGVDFALFFGPFAELVWGSDVRDRFDLVGFDPRGVHRSTGIKCFGNERQAVEAFAPFAFPLTPEEEEIWAEGDELLAEQCDRRGNRIAQHMSTANVARDLDLLRAAVGDEQVTYFGGSYGTYLGVTYANLYPDRVRAVAIDAVLDPIAWANVEGEVPFSTRLRSDQGAQATLEQFFELCEASAPGNCAFAPNPANRFANLAQRLLDEPLEFIDPETGEPIRVTYQDLIDSMLGTLYDPFAYAEGAELLAVLESIAFAGADAAPAQWERAAEFVNKRGIPHYQNFVENFPAVACSDGNNPSDYAVWSDEGAAADAEFGYFGRIWTWASSPCAQWPLTDDDRYLGPFNAHTANPVLVIGNRYDPATRYEGALAVRELLPNSALLTVDLAGHGSLGASGCAGFLTGQYLLDPSTATGVDGTVCPQEFNPFDFAADEPAPESARGLAPTMRAELMEQIGYRPLR